MAALSEMCSKDVSTRRSIQNARINRLAQMFKKLAHDWQKLRAIGIETNCEIKSKGKPKVDMTRPSLVTINN